MEHSTKNLKQQIEILFEHQAERSELNFQFIRDHALAVLQMSEQLMKAQGLEAVSGVNYAG
jgi:hypothetical protein